MKTITSPISIAGFSLIGIGLIAVIISAVRKSKIWIRISVLVILIGLGLLVPIIVNNQSDVATGTGTGNGSTTGTGRGVRYIRFIKDYEVTKNDPAVQTLLEIVTSGANWANTSTFSITNLVVSVTTGNLGVTDYIDSTRSASTYAGIEQFPPNNVFTGLRAQVGGMGGLSSMTFTLKNIQNVIGISFDNVDTGDFSVLINGVVLQLLDENEKVLASNILSSSTPLKFSYTV